MQSVLIGIWLISLIIMFSKFGHVLRLSSLSFFFYWVVPRCMGVHTALYLPVNERLDYF